MAKPIPIPTVLPAPDPLFERDIKKLRDYIDHIRNSPDKADVDVLTNVITLLVDAIESEGVYGFDIVHAFVDINKWIKMAKK